MATWANPREIAFIYEDGALVGVSEARKIITADDFEISKGMVHTPLADMSPEMVALGEQAMARRITELETVPVE